MNLILIERDVRNRVSALARCKYNLSCLQQANNPEYKDAIRLLSQEAFYLQDQLDRYNILVNLLKEDQPEYDEMLPRV